MGATPSVDSILAGAKKTLADADKFSASMPKTDHEYANAPYKMAHEAAKKQDGKEVESIASGLKWRADQQKALDK